MLASCSSVSVSPFVTGDHINGGENGAGTTVPNVDGEIGGGSGGSDHSGIFDKLAPSRKEFYAEDSASMGVYDGKTDIDGVPFPAVPGEKTTDIQAGTLTAGEWRDNADFESFIKLMNDNSWYPYMETWKMFPTRRIAVKITDENKNALKGVKVALLSESNETLWDAVTDMNGDAYLFVDLTKKEQTSKPSSIKYTFGDISSTYKLSDGEDSVEIAFNASISKKKKLDLLFMIDTTGSMGDELSYIQAELKDVILRAASAYEGMEIRLSVNFYRDIGDEYLVRYFKFNSDIDEAINNLAEQYASGGGDYPEAVDTAFDNAVTGHAWDDYAVKLMFFVLDAPPHSDRQGSVELMQKTTVLAAKEGIRVIPVASSGVDTETEYLLRTLASVTGGTYVFLTNHSGIGGDHLDPTVGDYNVEKLNELMVRLIKEYCA